jgi:REP element-mobilizing transposase RayT
MKGIIVIESTPEPLAFFLTWTTYGTWLPGDQRGWVSKPGIFQPPDPNLEASARKQLTETPITLDPEQRALVEDTIKAHCQIRGWHLHAVNGRTNHVHAVVTAPKRGPEKVMDQFKAWCTRRLKELDQSRNLRSSKKETTRMVRQKWWTQRGSKRRLFDEKSLELAIQYVLEAQDDIEDVS